MSTIISLFFKTTTILFFGIVKRIRIVYNKFVNTDALRDGVCERAGPVQRDAMNHVRRGTEQH